MNKQGYMLRVKQLEFALTEKTKEFDYQKGEFSRLKTAYKLSEKLIRELRGAEKSYHYIDKCYQESEEENTKLREEVKELQEIIKEAVNRPKGVLPESYSNYLNKN